MKEFSHSLTNAVNLNIFLVLGKGGSKIRQLMSAFVLLVLILVIEPLLLGVSAGWMSLRAEAPVRYWAEHPWRVFWTTFPLVLLGFVLGVFGFFIIGYGLIGIPGTLSLLSALHGLRSTWQRSHKKAILIVSVVWGLLIIDATFEALAQEESSLAQVVKLAGALLSGPMWITAALVAEYVSRQLTGGENK